MRFSPLNRTRELGSAKQGVEHWWVQRLTAIALVPLMLWLLVALIGDVGRSYTTVVSWLRAPLTNILMVLLLIALFYHTALGLQVVIEDYVHSDRATLQRWFWCALRALRSQSLALSPSCALPLQAEIKDPGLGCSRSAALISAEARFSPMPSAKSSLLVSITSERCPQ